MKIIAGSLFCVILCGCYITEVSSTNTTDRGADSSYTKVLSRRKRYVVFPEGSSFSGAVCMTIGMIGTPDYTLMSWAVNWGVAYDLPNETRIFQNDRLLPKPAMQRRSRRGLYDKIETAMDNMGFDGRSCILKTLCEASQKLAPGGSSLVGELFRTMFSLPATRVFSFEPPEHTMYDEAHNLGRNSSNSCVDMYPQCSVSLLDMALGFLPS